MDTFKYQPKTKEELKALCKDLSVNLGDIDTSLITDMSYLFYGSDRSSRQFSGIEKWNTSNVLNFSGTFEKSRCFQSISSWDLRSMKVARSFFNEREYPYLSNLAFFSKKKKVLEFFEAFVFDRYGRDLVIESIHPYSYHSRRNKRCTYVFKIKNHDQLFEMIFERGWGDIPQFYLYSLESSEREWNRRKPSCFGVMKAISKFVKVDDIENIDYKIGRWQVSFDEDKGADGYANFVGLNRALDFAKFFLPCVEDYKAEIFQRGSFGITTDDGIALSVMKIQ